MSNDFVETTEEVKLASIRYGTVEAEECENYAAERLISTVGSRMPRSDDF
jgi:hypothetical protein